MSLHIQYIQYEFTILRNAHCSSSFCYVECDNRLGRKKAFTMGDVAWFPWRVSVCVNQWHVKWTCTPCAWMWAWWRHASQVWPGYGTHPTPHSLLLISIVFSPSSALLWSTLYHWASVVPKIRRSHFRLGNYFHVVFRNLLSFPCLACLWSLTAQEMSHLGVVANKPWQELCKLSSFRRPTSS